MDQVPYANIVGSIMYTMVCTRPDIAHAVSVVSRYMGNLGKDHWNALKWVLRYLKGSADCGILFRRIKGFSGEALTGYIDSDYAANLDNIRSQSGYIFNLFESAVSWRSFLQSVVVLSTTEAEYMAMTEAVKEAIWLRGIISDFGLIQGSVTINCDSQSALHLAKHMVFHERCKHIDVRHHFVRDIVNKGLVKVIKVSTEDNAADMLTKTLPVAKFKYYLQLVNVLSK